MISCFIYLLLNPVDNPTTLKLKKKKKSAAGKLIVDVIGRREDTNKSVPRLDWCLARTPPKSADRIKTKTSGSSAPQRYVINTLFYPEPNVPWNVSAKKWRYYFPIIAQKQQRQKTEVLARHTTIYTPGKSLHPTPAKLGGMPPKTWHAIKPGNRAQGSVESLCKKKISRNVARSVCLLYLALITYWLVLKTTTKFPPVLGAKDIWEDGKGGGGLSSSIFYQVPQEPT